MSLIRSVLSCGLLLTSHNNPETQCEKCYLTCFITVATGMLASGFCAGWSSPYITILQAANSPIKVTAREALCIRWISSFGCICSLLITFAAVGKFGKKRILLCSSVLLSVGFLSIAFATNAVELCIGRALSGMGFGFSATLIPIFFTEIAPRRFRSQVSFFILLLLKISVLLTYGIGVFMSIKTQALVSTVTSVLYGVLLLKIPESRYFRNAEEKYPVAHRNFIGSSTTEIRNAGGTVDNDVAKHQKTRNSKVFSCTKKHLFTIFTVAITPQLGIFHKIMMYTWAIYDSVNLRFQYLYSHEYNRFP